LLVAKWAGVEDGLRAQAIRCAKGEGRINNQETKVFAHGYYDIMNRIGNQARGVRLRARGCTVWRAEGVCGAPEKRQKIAAFQNAGTMLLVPLGSTQVVDISSKMAKSCVVSGLISRRLGQKRAFFDPFLTCKRVGFSSVTNKTGFI
jgi:hypothetical protein